MNTEPPPPNPDDMASQQVRSQHITARVPDAVRRGVFSTGVILITGPFEFVIDFVQGIGQPPHVMARVVVPLAAMPQFVEALRRNWEMYTQRFGTPAEPPRGALGMGQRHANVQDLYDDLKIPDELLSGAYANGLMIAHSPSEFKLDFLTNMFPHSAVSCRVFVAAPQIPRIIESLHTTWVQYQQRIAQQQRSGRQGGKGGSGGPPRPSGAEPEEGPDEPEAGSGSGQGGGQGGPRDDDGSSGPNEE
jgi:hypothetical protein